jgi:CubicO group peptidase (beta-lactamase class C family)
VAGCGAGGQRLYIVPEAGLVVVMTAGLPSGDFDGQGVMMDLLDDYVLPAVASH